MRLSRIIASLILLSTFVAPDSLPISPRREHTSMRKLSLSTNIAENAEFAQQASNRCLTPYFWCYLPGYAPVGAACWCASPNGPVAGRVG
jgi:hypothetical protein